MSFFNKLKSRLTRSSSKLEKGLEDIVAENAAEPEASEAPEPEAEPKPQARPEPEPPEPVSLPDPTFPAPGYVPAPVTEPVEQENAQPAKAPLDIQPALPKADPVPRKPGLLGRMFGAEPKVVEPRRVLDDEMLESLEELLIASDMGVLEVLTGV